MCRTLAKRGGGTGWSLGWGVDKGLHNYNNKVYITTACIPTHTKHAPAQRGGKERERQLYRVGQWEKEWGDDDLKRTTHSRMPQQTVDNMVNLSGAAVEANVYVYVCMCACVRRLLADKLSILRLSLA